MWSIHEREIPRKTQSRVAGGPSQDQTRQPDQREIRAGHAYCQQAILCRLSELVGQKRKKCNAFPPPKGLAGGGKEKSLGSAWQGKLSAMVELIIVNQ